MDITKVPSPQPGENPIHIPLKTQNIDHLQFDVVEGKGEIYLQQHLPIQYMYNAHVKDTAVVITAKGTGIYTGEEISDTVTFEIPKVQGEGMFINEYFRLIEDNGMIVLKSRFGDVSVVVRGRFNMRFNQRATTETVWMPISRWNSWVVVNGTVTGEFSIRDPQTKRWSTPQPFSFNV